MFSMIFWLVDVNIQGSANRPAAVRSLIYLRHLRAESRELQRLVNHVNISFQA